MNAAETGRAKIEVAFRVYFEMVVSETDAFRILFIHSHEGDTAKELRALELGLISFMFPFFDPSMSEDHRRQLAGGVVGIAEGAAIVWLEQQESKGWPTPAAGAAERLARAKRHARVGRTAHRPPGLVDALFADDQREGLRQIPQLSRARVVGRLIAAGRIGDVELRRRFVGDCLTQVASAMSSSSGAKRSNCASCTALSALVANIVRTNFTLSRFGRQDHVAPTRQSSSLSWWLRCAP